MYPHEFEILWSLAQEGPSTAGELSWWVARDHSQPAQKVGNQMRRLVKAGFVKSDEERAPIYRLTEKGRAYVDA